MGWSAGFTLRNDGGVGISGGSCPCACEIADCTSSAAPSRLRLRLNWMVILVLPRTFVEVIESMPAIVENCFSNGVATDDAMVSGLAPGSDAFTWMVGKSTFGRSLTGKSLYAKTPKMTIAAMTNVVMMGRLMNPPEIVIVRFLPWAGLQRFWSRCSAPCSALPPCRWG